MSSCISNDVVDFEVTSPEGVKNHSAAPMDERLVKVQDEGVVFSSNQLSHDEIEELEQCESLMANGIRASMDMGRMLLIARDEKLCRGSHATFESYVREKWALSRPLAYQLMNASAILDDLSTMVDKSKMLPENERQLRFLGNLPDPRERATLWKEVVAASEREGVAVSCDLVQRVIDESTSGSSIPRRATNGGNKRRKRLASSDDSGIEKSGAVTDYQQLARLVDGIEEGLLDEDIGKVRVIVRQMRAILNQCN